MDEWRLKAHIVVSAWTTVLAETKEEAFEIANSREVGGLSNNAIYPGDDECWHFDNDGEPQNIALDSDI